MSKKKGDELIQNIQSMAVYMAYYMCKDTNAYTATVTVRNATYKGEHFGDYQVTIKRLSPQEQPNE